MRYLRLALDANLAIPIMNRSQAFRYVTRGYRELCLPVVVLGELYHGALKSKDVAINLEQVRRLVLRCEILNVDDSCAKNWAELRLILKSFGRKIPEADLWIAAICRANVIPLGTLDAHFDDIPGLEIVRP